MYSEIDKSVKYEELDWNWYMEEENEYEPLQKVDFHFETPYFSMDTKLNIILWNLSEENINQTKKVISYILNNFSKLFETAWLTARNYLLLVEPGGVVSERSEEDFYREQIAIKSPCNELQIDINCKHIEKGQAYYCFVVPTICDYKKWMISDDDLRLFMISNQCVKVDTNNVDDVLSYSGEPVEYQVENQIFEKANLMLKESGFDYAEEFK